MKLLVTGSTRSGQAFVSRELTRAGLHTDLETVWWWNGYTDWRDFEACVSFCAVPWLGDIDPDEVQVIHLVREPLAVMNSMIGRKLFIDERIDHRYRAFLRRHCPEAFERESAIERAAVWWLRWNERVEPYADDLLRVEDWGRSMVNHNIRANHRLDELPDDLHEAVIAKARAYGYPRKEHLWL